MLTAAVGGSGMILFMVLFGLIGIGDWNKKQQRERKQADEDARTNIALMRATGQYPDELKEKTS
jgi:hypothetical protein